MAERKTIVYPNPEVLAQAVAARRSRTGSVWTLP